MEEWKDIKGYEGLYKISNKGRVYNIKLKRFMGHESNKYMCVELGKYGKYKNYKVHRLVAQAFGRTERASSFASLDAFL